MFIVSVVILLAVTVLVAGSTYGCATGRIGVNPLVGIRIGYVRASDKAWRVGHRAALPLVLVGAVLSAGLALASLFPVSETARNVLILASACVLVLFAVIASVPANRAAMLVVADEYEESAD